MLIDGGIVGWETGESNTLVEKWGVVAVVALGGYDCECACVCVCGSDGPPSGEGEAVGARVRVKVLPGLDDVALIATLGPRCPMPLTANRTFEAGDAATGLASAGMLYPRNGYTVCPVLDIAIGYDAAWCETSAVPSSDINDKLASDDTAPDCGLPVPVVVQLPVVGVAPRAEACVMTAVLKPSSGWP